MKIIKMAAICRHFYASHLLYLIFFIFLLDFLRIFLFISCFGLSCELFAYFSFLFLDSSSSVNIKSYYI